MPQMDVALFLELPIFFYYSFLFVLGFFLYYLIMKLSLILKLRNIYIITYIINRFVLLNENLVIKKKYINSYL